jgi:hypothetical protein
MRWRFPSWGPWQHYLVSQGPVWCYFLISRVTPFLLFCLQSLPVPPTPHLQPFSEDFLCPPLCVSCEMKRVESKVQGSKVLSASLVGESWRVDLYQGGRIVTVLEGPNIPRLWVDSTGCFEESLIPKGHSSSFCAKNQKRRGRVFPNFCDLQTCIVEFHPCDVTLEQVTW